MFQHQNRAELDVTFKTSHKIPDIPTSPLSLPQIESNRV